MRISDWSSDVCSSDLAGSQHARQTPWRRPPRAKEQTTSSCATDLPVFRYRKTKVAADRRVVRLIVGRHVGSSVGRSRRIQRRFPVEQVAERQRKTQVRPGITALASVVAQRSEEHRYELQ